jgi:diacylglycerol kinase (ATP)
MVNKPKFNAFKNITYSIAGMVEVLRSENSFRLQLAVIIAIGVGLIFVPIATLSKLILFSSTWIILIAEAINSSIERVVDLVTQEYHELAKQAKDIGSFAVLLAFVLTTMIWGIVLYSEVSN